MKPFQFAVAILVALSSSCNSTPQKQSEPAPRFAAHPWPDRIIQIVPEDPSSQITLSWRTNANVKQGFAEYREATAKLDEKAAKKGQQALVKPIIFDQETHHYFQTKMKDLQPATTYAVRVGCENYRSEWFTVRTAPLDFQPFHFLYFGDVQNEIFEYAPGIFRKALMQFPDARFMVHSGDLALSSGNDETWGEWHFAGNWMFQQIPSMMAAGNSDHYRRQQKPIDQRQLYPQWHGSFPLPANGPEGLDNLAYYFDYPGIRIISLYTNFESLSDNDREIYLNEETKLTEALFHKQLEWIEKTMQTNPQPWMAVVMHHPVFTARKDRDNHQLQHHFLPLFEKYDVDIVLQGHDHVYARGTNPLKKNNLPVYIISIAGAKMREADPSHAWIDSTNENKQLFQAIHVTGDSLHFQSFDISGQMNDQFIIKIEMDGNKRILDCISIQ